MLPFRAIFNEILKVNYTNLEYFVWGQNNTIRWLNALAFWTQLIQIPRWCLSYSMVNFSSIHFAQPVCVCICRQAISTVVWFHNVLRRALVILRLTLLSFFFRQSKLMITHKSMIWGMISYCTYVWRFQYVDEFICLHDNLFHTWSLSSRLDIHHYNVPSA